MSNTLTGDPDTECLVIPSFEKEGMKHFFTTRKTPVELIISRGRGLTRDDENERDKNVPPIANIYVDRRGFLTPPEGFSSELVMVKQVHGDEILVIDKQADNISELLEHAGKKQCDAIITNQRNTGIGVVSADCLPALLYDPKRSVIAAVHAGWRGTLMRILPKVVQEMIDTFNCRREDIVVGIGPVIGICCYEVGEIVTEPLRAANPSWSSYLTKLENSKSSLDLTGLNIYQLENAGLLKANIFHLGLCTSCNEDLFPSYRRDGIGTGRIISGIIIVDAEKRPRE